MKINKNAKILIFDIETAPMLAYVWGLWDQNIGLNQIKSDWHVLSWSAKWYGDKKTMYADQRHEPDIQNDTRILSEIWKLLDEADIVVTQNGKKFDVKKLNTRFILNGMKPPSSFRHIDTLQIAKRYFSFTSNKLEYLTDKLCVKYKKLKHGKFSGFSMWEQCMKGNLEAWKEMEKYNKYDVLSLEELFDHLIVWDDTVNFDIYNNGFNCSCGSTTFQKNGFRYTNTGKFQRLVCTNCGKEHKSKVNTLNKEEKNNLKN